VSAAFLDRLPSDVFIIFAVFCRVGAFFATAPALGDFAITPRLRLAAALAVSFAVAPTAAPAFGALTRESGLALMTGAIIAELAVGGLLGLAAKTMAAALNVGGQFIALQTGFSVAQAFDPTQELQGAIVGGFLALLGTVMIFATDLHHVMLAALAGSYALFSPGVFPDLADASAVMTGALSSAFALGLRLAAPFVLFGLVVYVGAGLLNRLMPQAQVFFMLMPANLALGLMLLMLTIGVVMTAFLSAYEDFLAGFLS
jgi:flagellar biosynthetic protein FliR